MSGFVAAQRMRREVINVWAMRRELVSVFTAQPGQDKYTVLEYPTWIVRGNHVDLLHH